MRNCPACNHELEQAAVVQGKCPHCGAILRKLSQRTFENKRLPAASDNSPSADEVNEFDLDDFTKAEQTDTDPGSHTIEINDVTFGEDELGLEIVEATPLDENNVPAEPAADVPTHEADEFVLGESIDLDEIDDADIGQTIEISDVALDGDKMGLDIEDMTPLEDERQPVEAAGDATVESAFDESLDLKLSDPHYMGPTIEISRGDVDEDDEPQVDDNDITPLDEIADGDHKSPTVDYRTDMTMEFQPPDTTGANEPKPTRGPPTRMRATRPSTCRCRRPMPNWWTRSGAAPWNKAPSKGRRSASGKQLRASVRRCR